MFLEGSNINISDVSVDEFIRPPYIYILPLYTSLE